ncbi:MAG: fimbrillin family protein [Bacteroides sp.]|nr:fimbrillin family protein [Bacteroides sp.]
MTYRHIRTYRPTAVIALLAAVSLLTACDSDSTDNADTAVAPQFSADISTTAITRAVDQTWNSDQIGVIVTDAPNSDMETMYTNVPYYTTSTGTSADFNPTGDAIYFQEATETVTFAAYAPYQSAGGDITISDTRTVNASGETESIDYIFASATGSVSIPNVKFTFSHIMTKLKLVFKADGTTLTFDQLKDATFRLNGISHSGKIDLTPSSTTFGTAVADDITADWNFTSCPYTDTDDSRTYELILLPQSTGSMTLYVIIDDVICTADIDTELQGGTEYTYTVTVNREGATLTVTDVSVSVSDWGDGSSHTLTY